MGYRRRVDPKRESGGFVALPWAVLDSLAYQRLSPTSKALLLEVARQYHQGDNGRMLLSIRYLAPRRWRSPEVIVRAKRELLEAGLIFETVKGQRPNKASWYACTWLSLDSNPAYDAGVAQAFVRGAYRLKGGIAGHGKNGSLSTSAVLEKASIGTSDVLEEAASSTSDVAMQPLGARSPSTSDVHPLDMPSPGAPASALDRWHDDGGAAQQPPETPGGAA